MTEVPTEIKYLKDLWYLDIRSNKLQKIPDYLCEKQGNEKLLHLHLRSNKLTQIPESICLLKNLTTLTLRSNKLTSLPDSIGDLAELVQLDISQNKIISLPTSLQKCTKLEMLDIQLNNITELDNNLFANMNKMYKLGLKYNKLSSLPISLIKTKVTNLNVEGNNIVALPESLLSHMRINSLNLSRNKFTKLPNADGPLQWPDLQTLSIELNDIESIDLGIFGNCKNLHSVSFKNNCLLTLPFDIGTWGFNSLTEINLTGNKLENLPDGIGQLLELEILSLSQNALKRLPKSIGNLKSLKDLDLEENNLENLPVEIGNLTNLRKLMLSYNQLMTIPYTIGKLTLLTHLHLCDNNINALPKEIGELCSMTELYLSNNLGLNSLPMELAKAPELSVLALDKCPLSHFPQEYVSRGPSYIIGYMRKKNAGR